MSFVLCVQTDRFSVIKSWLVAVTIVISQGTLRTSLDLQPSLAVRRDAGRGVGVWSGTFSICVRPAGPGNVCEAARRCMVKASIVDTAALDPWLWGSKFITCSCAPPRLKPRRSSTPILSKFAHHPMFKSSSSNAAMGPDRPITRSAIWLTTHKVTPGDVGCHHE